MESQIVDKVIMITRIDEFSEALNKAPEFADAMDIRLEKVINSILEDFHGTFIKFEGVYYKILLFNNAEDAVRMAISLQKTFNSHPKMPIQIGIDKGTISIFEDSISGRPFEVAKVIAESAKPGSVIVSARIHKKINKLKSLHSEFIDKYEWKEKDLDVRMFAISEEHLVVPEPEEIMAKIKPIGSEDKHQKSKISHILISIGTLIAASAIFAYLNVLSSEPVIDDYSIAVLPFKNLGSGEDSEIISEAISKDILHNLSLLEDLYVISNYSSMQYRNSNKSTSQIAKELGVAFILSGSSHKFGDNIRISAQLIDVVANKVVWNRSFNRNYNEIQQIESEISKEIVDALRLRLSFDDMQNLVGIPTSNIDAYNAFIKARHETDKNTVLGTKKGIDLYSDAIRMDSLYAEAYADLAWANLKKARKTKDDVANISKLTELYLERAENINDQIAKIYMVRGALFNSTNQPAKAFSALNKALELAPNDVNVRMELATYYKNTNKPKDQLQQNKLAYQLDPFNFDTALEYVEALIINREFDEAEKLLANINSRLTDIDPVELDLKRVKLFLAAPNYDKVISPLIRMSEIDSTYLGTLAFSYIKKGDTSRAYAALDTIKTFRKSDSKLYNLAKIFAGIKRKDSLYKYLDSLESPSIILKDSIYHFFDDFKEESRFKNLLRPKPN